MPNESNQPDRKHPAHGVLINTFEPTIVFVTVCTKDRHKWLATQENHTRLLKAWSEAQTWLVGRYIVMPDHVHLFAGRNTETVTLDAWIRYWKSLFTRTHDNADWRWQTDHWDTRMRTVNQYEEKWEYVRCNAQRHGLVERAEDWIYQGELNHLIW